ncbi:MAG: alpha/beta hydrolase-fold protein [Parabacteroides sp.]|nr:alpha/beta hydrolase-fold protein [Parabacteroides sp.]
MKTTLLFLFGLMSTMITIPVTAQWRHTPTPNDTLQSVRVLGNGQVLFSIYAPQAKKVQIAGDIQSGEQQPQFTKNDSGVWSAALQESRDGVYRYHFIVDGVNVYDPVSKLANETTALATIVRNGDAFFMQKRVPHGAIARRYYYSETLAITRRLQVWTPAGYERSTDKLPVLYLIHGGGDNDLAWPSIGCACDILDNLYAEGKIKPMIVVMPNGTIQTREMTEEVPLFTKDLVDNIIPFIESNYRVLADKDHRAIAGLSMGGLETLDVGLNYYKLFGYQIVLSSGWFTTDKNVYSEKAVYLKKIAADYNKNVRCLYFTQGGPEDIAYNNCKEMLKLFDAAGIKYQYSEAPGGHTWYTWRNNLYDFAPKLF